MFMPVTSAADNTPLPFERLEESARELINTRQPRDLIRDMMLLLSARERAEISAALMSDDIQAMRARLRKITGGSLRAGRHEKALASKTLERTWVSEMRMALLPIEIADERNKRDAAEREERRRDRERRRERTMRRADTDGRAELDEHGYDGELRSKVQIDPRILEMFGDET